MKRAKLMIEGSPAYYIHNEVPKPPSVFLLHGENFNAQTWEKSGTLEFLKSLGYSAIAVELPNSKHSYTTNLYPETWLREFSMRTGIKKAPVFIAPSASGMYVLPFMLQYPKLIAGLVALAPVNLDHYAGKYSSIEFPVLSIWGEKDETISHNWGQSLANEVKNGEYKVIKGGGHSCYLDNTPEFHGMLQEFLPKCGI